ncbi:DNA primase [Phycicoccus endophyticus]|uniref:DNA primase n=1 Tax=Phycicoccus endophyticus TaxID=1690220 RepID=A0A7G9R3Y0_9MICO|nr:DNA primase [Phycicoccus endophyticus]NHI18139.1 DNA primase [Phycicoccus endophyticus]QNN50305.1 DNA primase [Phycicoccus endophyticus]GGL26148.1 DNA primase [Phycicoccus endophyticus]
MPGLIRSEDIATVKERSSIEDVVRDHVTLRPAGVGSLKGLCPFHDEKTPSFTIRPAVGSYHCFGCGEGGDVISFVQKVEHLTFTEAVERLAAKAGMELRYEEGGGPREGGVSLGRRSRLVEAHRVAEEYYTATLLDRTRGDARVGRDFLRERGFDSAAVERFGVGFAPADGDALTRHLLERGFTDDELTTGGLTGRGSRGLYDRFRGRLVWPIRDTTGDTVGFGARRLFEQDRIAAKYLNTSETPIYKKAHVLYGLDLAKKAIAGDRRAVVVEGYTDVMAAHLSGVEGAVATCGTAFGVEHIKILRRIMRDEADLAPARVVFTFDGDAAGQKAAMKAFGEDQRWAAQSFVAVAPDGMDPCELRLARGDAAVAALVDDAVPMFEFAVRTTIARFDLETAEGRVQAMKAVAPIIGSIRDQSLRPEYTRTVSGWLGLEVEQLAEAVRRAPKLAPPGEHERRATGTDEVPEPDPGEAGTAVPRPDLRDPVVAAERQLLQALIQHPGRFPDSTLDTLEPDVLTAPAHRAVLDGIRIAATGGHRAGSTAAWVAAVGEAAPVAVKPLVAELSVAPLPVRYDPSTGLPPQRYLDSLVVGVRDAHLGRRIADAMASLRRVENDPGSAREAVHEHRTTLQALEIERVRLRQAATT